MNQVVSRVSRIFKERYGASLIIDYGLNRQKETPVFRSHWGSPFVYSRTLRQVSFPIFNEKKQLKAVATAHPVENKDAIVFDEMAQFIQLTITEHINLTEEKALQTERQRAIEKAHADTSKVIELKTKKTRIQSFRFKSPKLQRKASQDPLWIEGEDLDHSSQIAFSVHDWISNWAFINAKEIPDLVWDDPHCWSNFEEVTIFIPKIETLSPKNIKKLEDNLSQLSKLQSIKPQVIVTSQGHSLSPQLEQLKKQFKSFKASQKLTARVQAHFLLFHYNDESEWLHACNKTNQVYFYPFSMTTKGTN